MEWLVDYSCFVVSDMDVSLCSSDPICRGEDIESLQVRFLFSPNPEGKSIAFYEFIQV